MLDNFQSLVYFLPETILAVTILAILAIDLLAGKPNLKRTAWLSARLDRLEPHERERIEDALDALEKLIEE